MKRYIALLLVAATVFSLLGGCSIVNTPTEPYEEPSEEEIFTKTIYDFEGLRVDSLDGQEHTNFIVYAKGVKEISVTGQTNVLVATDYENLSYTFANPDETLLSMKKGDTFFASVSEHCPEGVTVKVKDMVTSGNQLTVYSEPLGFADLFTYIDIFMDVPLDQVMPISGTDAPGSSASSSGSASGESEGSIGGTVKTNIPIFGKIEAKLGASEISCKIDGKIEYVTVKLRFSAMHLYVAFDAYADTSYSGELKVTGKNEYPSKREYRNELFKCRIPLWGPISVPARVNGIMSGFVSSSSYITFTEARRLGATVKLSAFGPSAMPINEVLKKLDVTSVSMNKLEAEVKVGLEFQPYLSAGFLGEIYASIQAGLGVSAEMDPTIKIFEKDAPQIHDCELCIQGKTFWFIDGSVGAEIKLATDYKKLPLPKSLKEYLEKNEALDKLELSLQFIDFEQPIRNFHVSKQAEDWVFGWEKCNNMRYKTSITVTKEGGGAAAGAIVTAVYPDDRQEKTIADDKGIAVIYLPAGESALTGSYGKESGSGTVQVEDAPTEAELSLRENQLYISVNITSSAYSSIRNTLSSLFPDAIFTSNPYNDGAKAGDVWLDVGGGITEIPIIDPYNLQSEPHWLSAPDGLYAHLSQFTEVDDSGYYENLSVELSVHSRSYSVAPTVDPDKYGRFIECKVQASLLLVSGETFIDIFEEVVPGVDFAGVLVSDYCTNPAYQEVLLHAGIPYLQIMKPYVELLLANLPIS